MWQGALSGRAEAVGDGLMVGAVATPTRSPAGKDWGMSIPIPFSHPLIFTREPTGSPEQGEKSGEWKEENKQVKPAHLPNMHHFI